MAEERGNLLVTQEGTKSDGGTSGRTSMGKLSSSKSGEKVLPRYLRVSTGSCHELCKYGRKHAFEAKERCPMAKRIAKPSIDNQSQMKILILPETEKTLVVRPKSSPDPKSFSSDVPEIINHEVSTRSPNGRNVLNISVDSHNPLKGEVLFGIKKTSAAKLRPSPTFGTHLSESPKFNRQELSALTKMELSSKSVKSKSKEKNASLKHACSLKPKSLDQNPLSSLDSGGLSGRRNCDIMTGPYKAAIKKVIASPGLSLSSPMASVSPKPSISRVSKKVMASPIVSQASPRASLSAKPSICRVAKQVYPSPSVSLASPSPRPSLSRVASLNERKRTGFKVVSPMKNQGRTKTGEPKGPKIELKHTNNDLVQEKTLHIIKMETENKSLESDQNESYVVEPAVPPSCLLAEFRPVFPSSPVHNEEEQEISEYTESGTEDASLSESDETISTEDVGDEHPGRPRWDGMVYSEDKGSQAMELHCGRGKVVDIQSQNKNPGRLNFRRGRVLGEIETLKGDGRRSFKKKGIDVVVIESNPGSQEVVLRHQDVQGKKASPILLNKVIEQTASKLAEIRKSKVKALVGAFETVISLQDTKPSANTVA